MDKKFIEMHNLLAVTTTQTSKTFYFIPVGGWKRGVNYRPIDKAFSDEVNSLCSKNVIMQNSTSRYLEYVFISSNTEDNDFSTDIREAIEIMLTVAEKHKVEILTVSTGVEDEQPH